jgi:hypothetical protein
VRVSGRIRQVTVLRKRRHRRRKRRRRNVGEDRKEDAGYRR